MMTDTPSDNPSVADGTPRGRIDSGDAGLFSADSVTWRLHSDPLMGLAGLRALLLQGLHPAAMSALEQYSCYGTDPWRRLTELADYLGITTYGSAGEAMLAGARVRAVQAMGRGVTSDGVTYAGDDPQVLAWLHCCLVASFLEIVTRGGLALTGAEQDAYIGEQVAAGMLVGLEPDEVPHDRSQLLDYFRTIRPALHCSPAAQVAARIALTPQSPPGPAHRPRPAWAPVAGLAFAALPPWARRLYALPALPATAELSEAATTIRLRELRAELGAQTRWMG